MNRSNIIFNEASSARVSSVKKNQIHNIAALGLSKPCNISMFTHNTAFNISLFKRNSLSLSIMPFFSFSSSFFFLPFGWTNADENENENKFKETRSRVSLYPIPWGYSTCCDHP